MMPYHDRMPVLLRAEDFDAWLKGSLGADALRPAAESISRMPGLLAREPHPAWGMMSDDRGEGVTTRKAMHKQSL